MLLENSVEAGGVDGPHANSHELEMVVNREVIEHDDRKVPPIFGRLWREYVSVFTLAFAPGLNVVPVCKDSPDYSSCLLEGSILHCPRSVSIWVLMLRM
jgi:hypothetical protein